MKTYEETVWKLALEAAHFYLSGGYNKWPDGTMTVAWIYGVTYEKLASDVNALRDKAYAAAQKGEQ